MIILVPARRSLRLSSPGGIARRPDCCWRTARLTSPAPATASGATARPSQPRIPAPVRRPAHPGRGTHARRSRSRCCRRSRLSEEDCATTRDDLASPASRCCFLQVPERASIPGQSSASKRVIVKQSRLRPTGDVVARARGIGPDSSPAGRTIDIITVGRRSGRSTARATGSRWTRLDGSTACFRVAQVGEPLGQLARWVIAESGNSLRLQADHLDPKEPEP